LQNLCQADILQAPFGSAWLGLHGQARTKNVMCTTNYDYDFCSLEKADRFKLNLLSTNYDESRIWDVNIPSADQPPSLPVCYEGIGVC